MLAPVLALAMMQAPATVTEFNKGSHLYRQCRAALRVDEGNARDDDQVEASYCAAFMAGFTEGLTVAGDRKLCTVDATMGTIARVFVAYMDAHPKNMDEIRTVGLINALIEKYACPRSTSKRRP